MRDTIIAGFALIVAAVLGAVIKGVYDSRISKADRAAEPDPATASHRQDLSRWRDAAAKAIAAAEDTLDRTDPARVTATFLFDAPEDVRKPEAERILNRATDSWDAAKSQLREVAAGHPDEVVRHCAGVAVRTIQAAYNQATWQFVEAGRGRRHEATWILEIEVPVHDEAVEAVKQLAQVLHGGVAAAG
jgi:hypothetical protein